VKRCSGGEPSPPWALSKLGSTCGAALSLPLRVARTRVTESGPRYDQRMRRTLALVLRVASVPVGVGVGLGTAQLAPSEYQCPPNALCLLMKLYLAPTFATWQCILFGAGAAAVLLLLSLAFARMPSTRALKTSGVAAAVAGVGVGLWTAQLQSLEQCPSYARCPNPAGLVLQTTFAAWQCALFGAGAAVVLLLLYFAAARLPTARRLKTA
jgi:hypothetical protein